VDGQNIQVCSYAKPACKLAFKNALAASAVDKSNACTKTTTAIPM
jgi:hypothetical protein